MSDKIKFRLRPRTRLFTALALGLLLNACSRSGPPYSPEASLETMRIEKGFRMELFVAEPEIADPVAMAFDENGRIFVVEMPGYPLETGPTGRVKLLEDTDGDGRPDRTTIFADSLVLPTGVMRWKKGILVTAAPDVWYLEDTDGDRRADVRRKVLTGLHLPIHNTRSTVRSMGWTTGSAWPTKGRPRRLFSKISLVIRELRFASRTEAMVPA